MSIKTNELQQLMSVQGTDSILADSAAGTGRVPFSTAAQFFDQELVKPGSAVGAALENKAAADFSNLPNPQTALYNLGAGTGRNLLDNWYFADPVNQRRLTEYGEGYTIDRWCLYTSGTTKISIENGVVIHEGAGGYFQQRFERSKMEKLLGQVATLSVLIDNQLYSATDILGYPGNKCIIRGLPVGESSLFWDDVKCEVNFSLTGGAGVLQAVKLELGSQQTLAHQDTAGNWVLNDPPPDPTLELLKCQRYFKSIGGVDTHMMGQVNYSKANEVIVNVPGVPMRATPTLSYKPIYNSSAVVFDGQPYAVTGAKAFSDKLFMILIDSDLPAKGPAAVYLNEDIWLSAEL